MRRLFRTCISVFSIASLACASPDITPPTIETTTFAPSIGVDLAASTKPPSGLYYRDITVGTGTAVASGQ